MAREVQCKRCGRFLAPDDALIIEPPGLEFGTFWFEDDGEIVCADCVTQREADTGRVFEYGPDDPTEDAEILMSRPWVSSTDDVLEGRED
jgi:hypothetical protein